MPSTSQVNKAGKTLRKWQRGELLDSGTYERAIQVLLDFRAEHRDPLASATMGLRSAVSTEGCKMEVSQRLKRVPTILDKLLREPNLQLATMQDVGGCRAVLQSLDEIRRVRRRVSKNRPPFRVSDYIAAPRSTGYRAVHLVVPSMGRRIEIQLRTPAMHEWAFTMEKLSGRLREDLKGGKGPPEVRQFMKAVSAAMALEEAGKTVDNDLVNEIRRLRQEAVPYLQGGHK